MSILLRKKTNLMSNCGMCEMLHAPPPNAQMICENQEACAVIKYGQRSFPFLIDFLIVPKRHFQNMKDEGAAKVLEAMTNLINFLAGKEGEYTIKCNNGPSANQTLFHLHWHVSSTQSHWPMLTQCLAGRSLNFFPHQTKSLTKEESMKSF
jgi:diadenosine tetraphosphate (Ap4A) HIT family hydrolase